MNPAERIRREVVGDRYVDAALADASPGAAEFQAYLTERAWSEWARPGLGRRERSLLTIGILAALGRLDELAAHLGGAVRNGLTDTELDEVVRHIGAYAGIPASIAARRALVAARAAVAGEGP